MTKRQGVSHHSVIVDSTAHINVNMQVPVVHPSVRLTHVEEELYLRVQNRVRIYFQDFKELEGFSVLESNVQRLLSKVELELRSVFLHHHDVACKIEQLQVKLYAFSQKLDQQRATCDQVITAARKVTKRTAAALDKRTNELQAFHATEVKLHEKNWDKRLQDHLQVLSGKFARQFELLELEQAQQVEAMKRDLKAKKNAEIEYVRVQMRLQIASQLDRETRRDRKISNIHPLNTLV